MFIPGHLFCFAFRNEGLSDSYLISTTINKNTPKARNHKQFQNTNTQIPTRFFHLIPYKSVLSARNGSSSTQRFSTPKKPPKPSQLRSTTTTTATNPPQQQKQPQNQSSPGLHTTHLPLTTTTPHLGSSRVLLTNVSSPLTLVRHSLTVLILLPSQPLLHLPPRFSRSIS